MTTINRKGQEYTTLIIKNGIALSLSQGSESPLILASVNYDGCFYFPPRVRRLAGKYIHRLQRLKLIMCYSDRES